MKQANGMDKQTEARIRRQCKEYCDALVYVTLACNLRCPRCFLHDLESETRRYMMTWEQYVRIIERLREQNVHLRCLQFTGGEPTLWPHLCRAIAYAKAVGICDHVRISTNAVDRRADDYAGADSLVISHYGAVNRHDMLRLQRTFPGRVRIICVDHLPWPFPEGPDPATVPADCNCVLLTFLGDRVWPCGFSAARGTGNSVSVEDNFYYQFINGDPRRQALCAQCLSNRNYRQKHLDGLTVEFGVWDSDLVRIWGLKSRLLWLRRLRSWWKGKAIK